MKIKLNFSSSGSWQYSKESIESFQTLIVSYCCQHNAKVIYNSGQKFVLFCSIWITFAPAKVIYNSGQKFALFCSIRFTFASVTIFIPFCTIQIWKNGKLSYCRYFSLVCHFNWAAHNSPIFKSKARCRWCPCQRNEIFNK